MVKHHLKPGGSNGRYNLLWMPKRLHKFWHNLFGRMDIWQIRHWVEMVAKPGIKPEIYWMRLTRNADKAKELADSWHILFDGLDFVGARPIIDRIMRGKVKLFIRVSVTRLNRKTLPKKHTAMKKKFAKKIKRRRKTTK